MATFGVFLTKGIEFHIVFCWNGHGLTFYFISWIIASPVKFKEHLVLNNLFYVELCYNII